MLFFTLLALSSATLLFLTRAGVPSRTARKRLVSIKDSVQPQSARAVTAELRPMQGESKIARLGAFLQRYGFGARLQLLLVQANIGLGVGAAFLGSMAVGLAGGGLSFWILRSALGSIATGLASSAVPCGWLRYKRSRRVKEFNAALPDAIDLMARSLRAGHAMGAAIEMVAEQAPNPLGFEFFQVYQQQRLGLQFRDALLTMSKRVPSRDLHFLVTAILVQKETGGDLTEILDRASYVIRERVRIEGEVRTHTAQGRLTGWILAALPVIMLVLINFASPGYSSLLFHDPLGQHLLWGGGAMIAIGALMIRKIVDVKI
jgi:tight adherence protein B